MNKAQVNKKNNTIIFFVCVFFSLIMMGVMGFLSLKILSSEADRVKKDSQVCVEVLLAHGFNATIRGGNINAGLVLYKDIEPAVNKASLIIAHCPEHKIKSFCAGFSCKPSGVSFTLEHY